MGLFDNGRVKQLGGVDLQDLTRGDFELFRKLIYEQSGISLNDSKKELLRTRLRARLVREGYSSYREYYKFVKADRTGKALVPLLDDISTNLTSFFREINHFKFLNSSLPDWIAKKEAKKDFTFRVWSAGCSSGEEPYTLMFTLLSHLANKMPPWNIKFLATDLSTEILQRAVTGLYGEEKIADVPPAMVKAYFTREFNEKGMPMVRVKREISNMITFKRFNLISPSFPFRHKFDFIFCRNVMIYFDRPTQEVLVRKYHSVLKPGGHLFIGHSESLTGLNHEFKYSQPTIYQK